MDLGANAHTAAVFFDLLLENPTSSGTIEDKPIPTAFALHQNYPNPFNPATTIKFSIATPSTVSLKVFDIRGREVAVLLQESLNAGSFEVPFSADDLYSGVYFYRLEAGAFVQTKKLTLLR